MKALFCEETLDISIILSSDDVKGLKRDETITPILDMEYNGRNFLVMNSEKCKHYIDVIEPLNPSYQHYAVKLSDKAYEDLIRHKKCGDRYGGASKISVIIDEE